MKTALLAILIFLHPGCRQHHPLNILAIGDSNGASPIGWVYQLKEAHPGNSYFNCSTGGNTIGFDNLGKKSLNTLANIENYLRNAEDSLKKLDKILIMLGTNDCKAVFDTLQHEVPVNLDKLIYYVKNYPYKSGTSPEIILISPPPIGNDSILLPKYFGGMERLQKLLPHYRDIAKKYGCRYIDIFNPLKEDFLELTEDGIHLNEAGYKKAAVIIGQYLE
ncbi:MAG: hypothetical protein JXB00_04690 [Bacteroidales bacterium]|nr:hypothetical protein [Bacteroidales bacterium]